MVVVAVVAAWPAVSQPGLLNTRGGGDSPFLLQRLHQLTTALAGGHFPVRWMPDAAYGDGYPFYNYYAPLSIYIAAAFRGLGFSYVRAIHLAQLAGFIVAGLGTFYLGRRWLRSDWAGLLAAVAYTVAPFHMVNVYVRGDSLAEFWAMAWYPVVLMAADGLVTSQRPARRRAVALFALAYAALILSHNISALIFSPFLLLYLSLRFWNVSRRPAIDAAIPPAPLLPRSPAPPLAALALAFALTAFFFVPALAEQSLAQLGPVTAGYFHYSNHFRGLDLVGR
ncbi:MAG TPA: 6-pyruvoyl-tetrahydropterin synthase-related protein, partial [Promineifilum sp.]|nr:6-pyruvoyl-tetrahydropterin synthase-related protein [Promineifilum sp.]